MAHSERMKRARQQVKMGLGLNYAEPSVRPRKGTFIFDMRDARTGEQLAYFEKDNIITLDAGIAGAAMSP